MNFSFKDCLKNALVQAVGSKPDFEIILAASEWVERKVFVEADVEEIQAAIDKQYVAEETSSEETEVTEPIEEA